MLPQILGVLFILTVICLFIVPLRYLDKKEKKEDDDLDDWFSHR